MAVVSQGLPLLPELTWKSIYYSKLSCPVPFTLNLFDGSCFYAEEIIRLVPAKRLIAYGHWNGKPVFAKFFFHPKRANQHLEKEFQTTQRLQDKNILTPTLYFHGFSQDKKIGVMLFERIFQINNVSNYRNQNFSDAFFSQLLTVVQLIARQHYMGIFQNDTHLNNFLLTDVGIYTIDGAKMDFFAEEIPRLNSLTNLAWFFYDFGPGITPHLEKIYSVYARARQWDIVEQEFQFFVKQIKFIRRNRWHRLVEKIYRGSSDFMRLHYWHRPGMCYRKEVDAELIAFIKQPDKILKSASANLIKSSSTQKTYEIQLSQRQFIVKCYDRGGFARLSPAAKMWRIVHQLSFFGWHMPRPVAFFEKRYFGLCTKSYVVLAQA